MNSVLASEDSVEIDPVKVCSMLEFGLHDQIFGELHPNQQTQKSLVESDPETQKIVTNSSYFTIQY